MKLIWNESYSWNFRIISVMLNELTGWSMDSKNGCRRQESPKGNKYFFF